MSRSSARLLVSLLALAAATQSHAQMASSSQVGSASAANAAPDDSYKARRYERTKTVPHASTDALDPGPLTNVSSVPFKYEFGARYMFSTGHKSYTLYGFTKSGGKLSRLTWGDMLSNSGEAYGRIDHVSGLFLKGYGGMSSTDGGRLTDEDFPVAVGQYSSTDSKAYDGAYGYAAIDLGYDFWRTGWWDAGAFVGYQYQHDVATGKGCSQVAGNPDICPPGLVSSTQPVIKDAEVWQGVRVGGVGRVFLTPRVRLTGDVAYLPYVNLSGADTHVARVGTDFSGATPVTGTGMGVSVEGKADYFVNPMWSLGVGVRYTELWADGGKSHFEKSALPVGSAKAQVVDYDVYHLGGFLTTAIHF